MPRGNLLQILRHLRDHGPSRRNDIASGCGLAMLAMTDLISELRGAWCTSCGGSGIPEPAGRSVRSR